MTEFLVTVDLDWACESAVEETLTYLWRLQIKPTVFVTHPSSFVEKNMDRLEVGLHPYFGENSSHGCTITEVVSYVMNLKHNIKAYRCHQFARSNASCQAMSDAGMKISSNVCASLEMVPAFKDRYGQIEVPIFMEDGGFLWQQYSLDLSPTLLKKLKSPGVKVLLIHPMHFAVNTPRFDYMRQIKSNLSRLEWQKMDVVTLESLRYRGRGIRHLLMEILGLTNNFITMEGLYQRVEAQHNYSAELL